jgi:ribosome-binding factor A
MSSIRVKKVEKFIQREVADTVLNEIKDPRISQIHTTITHVKVSKDLRIATVYISVMGNEEKTEATMKGFESAKGFIQSRIGKLLRLRFTPEIRFKLDDSLKEGDKIIKKLKELGLDESQN